MTRTRISTDGIADGAVTSAKLASQIGIGTDDPQTTLQIVTGGASNTLEGAAQTEIFQIIDGSDDPYVERTHPMVMPIAAGLGMTAEQVDQAFIEGNLI